jgi:N-acetylmuramoyl-L-alanine amidase
MYPQNWSPNSLTNRELLARTLEAEAGNQGLGGMIAVGAVIRNRTGSGQSIRDTILAPGQFSAWNSWTKYMDGAQGQNMAAIKPSADAYSAADSVLSNGFEDITGGATHYYNPDLANPVWGQSAGGNWKTIGSHVFGIPEGEQPNPRPTGGDNPVVQNTANNSMGSQPMSQQAPEQGFLGKLASGLADPRTRAALTSMSRTQLGRRLNEVAQREVGQNRTAQWLMTQEGGRPYAEAIMNGSISADQAYTQWLNEKNKKRNTTKIGNALIDTDTGEVIYGNASIGSLDKDQVGVVGQLNGQLQKVYGPYMEIFNGFNLINSAIQRKDETGVTAGIDDLVITIAFAKILDPESVVRSEESAAINRAGGGVAALFGGLQNFLTGQGILSEDARNQIYTVATQTAQTWFEKASQEYNRVMQTAELYGIPRNIAEKVISPPQKLDIQPIPAPTEDDTKPEQPNGPVPSWAAPLDQRQWNNLTANEVKELTEQARKEGKV